ncbi:MAG: XTP/dITP diphosphatase [Bacilli bacterium]|nr:XTP/dITP diphosphatase [Bacilli bacterium]
MNKLIVASNNQHKIKEIRAMLNKYNIEVFSLKDINLVIDVEETGSTFKENAFIKARAIYDIIKLPVLSDDSGLEVKALNNEPGIYSARYAGAQHNDQDNLDKLLFNLKDVKDTSARYVCAMVLIIDINHYYQVEGYLEGRIVLNPCGQNGFGYDPVFYLDDYKKTVAQISDEEKNKISHRYHALKQIEAIISELGDE